MKSNEQIQQEIERDLLSQDKTPTNSLKLWIIMIVFSLPWVILLVYLLT